jgi:hypothetical protein
VIIGLSIFFPLLAIIVIVIIIYIWRKRRIQKRKDAKRGDPTSQPTDDKQPQTPIDCQQQLSPENSPTIGSSPVRTEQRLISANPESHPQPLSDEQPQPVANERLKPSNGGPLQRPQGDENRL